MSHLSLISRPNTGEKGFYVRRIKIVVRRDRISLISLSRSYLRLVRSSYPRYLTRYRGSLFLSAFVHSISYSPEGRAVSGSAYPADLGAPFTPLIHPPYHISDARPKSYIPGGIYLYISLETFFYSNILGEEELVFRRMKGFSFSNLRDLSFVIRRRRKRGCPGSHY